MNKNMRRRRVHFLPENNTVFEIESCKSFTKQEIRDSWYKPSRLEKVVRKRSNAALEWESSSGGGNKSSSSLYLRGLEQYTKEGGERTARTIESCVVAVLDEQDIQWSLGEDDVDRFAAVSQKISQFSVGLALLRAAEDELEANRVYTKFMRRKQKVKQKLKQKCFQRSYHRAE